MYGLGSKQASLSRNVRCSLRDEPNNGHAEDNATLNVGSETEKRTKTVLLAWSALFTECTLVQTFFKNIGN